MSSATERGRHKRWRAILWLESTPEYKARGWARLYISTHTPAAPGSGERKKHAQMAAEDVKFAYPDPNENMSKRQWEKAVAAWRAELRKGAGAAELEGLKGDLSGPPDT